jgi:hypothetical protein
VHIEDERSAVEESKSQRPISGPCLRPTFSFRGLLRAGPKWNLSFPPHSDSLAVIPEMRPNVKRILQMAVVLTEIDLA